MKNSNVDEDKNSLEVVKNDKYKSFYKPALKYSDTSNDLGNSEVTKKNTETEVEELPPSFWKKLKSFARAKIPIVCKVYSKHELWIENLLTSTLHIGGLQAHKALKNYCLNKIFASKPTEVPNKVVSDARTGKFQNVLNWINKKLVNWSNSEKGVGPSPPSSDYVEEAVSQNEDERAPEKSLIFYPKKLNLIIFGGSGANSSSQMILDDVGGEENSDSAQELKEEVLEELKELQMEEEKEKEMEMTTPFSLNVLDVRKAKRSNPETDFNPDTKANDQKLKQINDLAVVISSFDRSPYHSAAMASPMGVREDQIRTEELARKAAEGNAEYSTPERHVEENSKMSLQEPPLPLTPEIPLPNEPMEPAARPSPEKEKFHDKVFKNYDDSDTIEYQEKDNFYTTTEINFESEMIKLENTVEHEITEIKEVMASRTVFVYPVLIILILIICGLFGFYVYKKKKASRYSVSESDLEENGWNEPHRYIDIRVEEGNEIDGVTEVEASGYGAPVLKEKGLKKSRRESYEEDLDPPRSKKRQWYSRNGEKQPLIDGERKKKSSGTSPMIHNKQDF